MTVKIIHDRSPGKYRVGPGWNSRPLDLQSGATQPQVWLFVFFVSSSGWPGLVCSL